MMADGALLAPLLAALAGGALVCGLFLPVLMPPPEPSQGEAFRALMQRLAGEAGAPEATRRAHRAQAIALKLVAEERRARGRTRLSHKLDLAGLDWPAWACACVVASVGLIVFSATRLFGMSAGTGFSAALTVAVLLPARALDMMIQRRQRRFLAGFAAAVDMIVRGARSGLSLSDCLGIVASDAAPAVRAEFAPLVAQLKAGVSVAVVIDKLAMRMPVPEARFFAIVLSVQSQTGGNFTDALANLANVLRERDRLAAKVRAASAEVRASALIIGALPFLVVGVTALLAPDHIAVMWKDEAGRRLSGLCVIWLIVGIAVLRRMARVEP